MCVNLFEIDRVPAKSALLVPKFAMFEIDFHWESSQMTTTPLLGLIRLRNSQKFDLCTFSKWCLTLFEFDRVPAKSAHLVPKFVMFELVFLSESPTITTTLLLGLVMLHYSQKCDPYTFLGWYVRLLLFDKYPEKTAFLIHIFAVWGNFHIGKLEINYNASIWSIDTPL